MASMTCSTGAATGATRKHLVEALRADYMRRVRELAERLRPRLAGVRDEREEGDDWQAATDLLEAECKAALCSSEQDAQLVLGLSRYWDEDNVLEFIDHLEGVSTVAALDVAGAMGARWYFRFRRVEVRS